MPKLTISDGRLVIRGPSGTRYVFERGQSTEVLAEDVEYIMATGKLFSYWQEQMAAPQRQMPLHIIRHPGLGDKVFALAAAWAFKQEHPDITIYFETHDYCKNWIERVPFVRFGRPAELAQTVDFDNIPANAGDRCKLFGRMLGVEVNDIRFPVETFPYWRPLPEQYAVFAPWCGPWKLRSLPQDTIKAALRHFTDVPLAIVSKDPCPFPSSHIDLTGPRQGPLECLWDILGSAAAVISVDTGITWMAAALGKPTLAFFGHVPPQDRAAACHTVYIVEPHMDCPMFPCGDHGAPPAPCGATEEPKCMKAYTPEVVLWKIREFLAMVL